MSWSSVSAPRCRSTRVSPKRGSPPGPARQDSRRRMSRCSALPVDHANVLEAWKQVYHEDAPKDLQDSFKK